MLTRCTFTNGKVSINIGRENRGDPVLIITGDTVVQIAKDLTQRLNNIETVPDTDTHATPLTAKRATPITAKAHEIVIFVDMLRDVAHRVAPHTESPTRGAGGNKKHRDNDNDGLFLRNSVRNYFKKIVNHMVSIWKDMEECVKERAKEQSSNKRGARGRRACDKKLLKAINDHRDSCLKECHMRRIGSREMFKTITQLRTKYSHGHGGGALNALFGWNAPRMDNAHEKKRYCKRQWYYLLFFLFVFPLFAIIPIYRLERNECFEGNY